jgi:hypothetical protein
MSRNEEEISVGSISENASDNVQHVFVRLLKCLLEKSVCTYWRDTAGQGCQMVYLQTKQPNLGKFFKALNRTFWYFLVI